MKRFNTHAVNSIWKNWVLAYILGTLFWVATHIPKFVAQGVDWHTVLWYMVLLLITFIAWGGILSTRNVFDFYYLFIFAGMVLSVIMAPAMFIQQNALAGWLWIGAFVLLMLFLLCDTTKDTAIARTQYETWLGTIIAWVCIVGQWIIIFINPMHGLLYNFGLTFMALGSVYFGWWAEHHRGRTEAQKHQIMMGPANKYGKDHREIITGTPVNEARSTPSVYDAYLGADIETPDGIRRNHFKR